MSNTFVVRLQLVSVDNPGYSSVSDIDLWSGLDIDGNPIPTVNGILAVLNNPDFDSVPGQVNYSFSGTAAANLRFDTGGSNIILNGNFSNPFELNGLPAGFTPLSATLRISYSNQCSGAGSLNMFLQHAEIDESPAHLITSVSGGQLTWDYDFSGTPPTIADIVGGGAGLRLALVLLDAGAGLEFNYLNIEGTYEVQSFQFPFVETPEYQVQAGDPISIISVPIVPHPPPPEPPLDDDTKLNLLNATEIVISYDCSGVPTTTIIPSSDFTDWTWYNITFILPTLDCNPSVIDLDLSIIGTQFTGSVPLGSLLTIVFINGTGIYKLVPHKTADTIYVQDYNPVVEVDVKIPDPFIKTAFVGG